MFSSRILLSSRPFNEALPVADPASISLDRDESLGINNFAV